MFYFANQTDPNATNCSHPHELLYILDLTQTSLPTGKAAGYITIINGYKHKCNSLLREEPFNLFIFVSSFVQ